MLFKFAESASPSIFDHDQKYPVYFIISFVVISILSISLIIFSDYRNFEKSFATDVEKIQTKFNFYINQNESVLEGLSAFISAVGDVNDEMLDRYALKVKTRFPHVFMLEVAGEVKRSNLKSFIDKRRYDGYTDFDVRAFDYDGNREWRT